MNHLVIRLGGTGGKIIRALRKSLYQEFHGEKMAEANWLLDVSLLRQPTPNVAGRCLSLNKATCGLLHALATDRIHPCAMSASL